MSLASALEAPRTSPHASSQKLPLCTFFNFDLSNRSLFYLHTDDSEWSGISKLKEAPPKMRALTPNALNSLTGGLPPSAQT